MASIVNNGKCVRTQKIGDFAFPDLRNVGWIRSRTRNTHRRAGAQELLRHPRSDAMDGVDDRDPKWSRSPGLLDGVFHRVCEKWASTVVVRGPGRASAPADADGDRPYGGDRIARCGTLLCVSPPRKFHRVRCSGGGPCLRLFTLRNSFMKDPGFTEYVPRSRCFANPRRRSTFAMGNTCWPTTRRRRHRTKKSGPCSITRRHHPIEYPESPRHGGGISTCPMLSSLPPDLSLSMRR